MPVYHVIIGLKSRPRGGIIKENILERELFRGIVEPYNRGEDFRCDDEIVSRDDITNIKITESEIVLIPPLYHPSPQRHFADRWQAINQMKDVTDKFIKTPSLRKKEKTRGTVPSKNVFIVHGRDHKSMKELKTMLKQFGLNPIVLHEQPSGSRTIVEKLEKYSDVGYAFVILTPDDKGYCQYELDELFATMEEEGKINYILSLLKERARQNVVLEFGYFIGRLERDRVCCLYKGEVELPSDMHGIVYIRFKESVNEVKNKIMKELKEAGYEVKM